MTRESLQRVQEELEVIRETLGDIQRDIQYAVRNELAIVLPIISFAKDPTAPDFRINQVPPEVVEELRRQVQKDLF